MGFTLAGRGSTLGRFQASCRTTPHDVDLLPTVSMSRSRCRHGSRRDLKNEALVLAAAGVGCAKDISIFIHGYAAVGLRALAAADEVVKVGKSPAALSRRKLEYHAEAIRTFSFGKAVNVSIGERELVVGSPITAGQAVERAKLPALTGRRQLVHDAATVDPAVESTAVKIAGFVQDQASHWICAIILTMESV